MTNINLRRFYIVGEQRRIEWEIIPNYPDDTITIDQATYEIYDENNELVDSGSCDVTDTKVGMMFVAESTGTFLVRLFVTVSPEIVACEITCVVNERS